MSLTTSKRSNPISFRLDERLEQSLRDRADMLGISSGEHARRLVVEGLMGGEGLKVQDELVELKTEVARLRQVVGQLQGLAEVSQLREEFCQFANHFKLAVLALLVGGGQMAVDEARAWVNKNLSDKAIGG